MVNYIFTDIPLVKEIMLQSEALKIRADNGSINSSVGQGWVRVGAEHLHVLPASSALF